MFLINKLSFYLFSRDCFIRFSLENKQMFVPCFVTNVTENGFESSPALFVKVLKYEMSHSQLSNASNYLFQQLTFCTYQILFITQWHECGQTEELLLLSACVYLDLALYNQVSPARTFHYVQLQMLHQTLVFLEIRLWRNTLPRCLCGESAFEMDARKKNLYSCLKGIWHFRRLLGYWSLYWAKKAVLEAF